MLVSNLAFAQQAPSPSALAKLTGHAAIERLIGNTMTGTADGEPYFAFYDKDGTVKMQRGGDVSTEDLRVTLQRYRSFFSRLLAI